MPGELNLAPVRGPSVWEQARRVENARRERSWAAVAGGAGLIAGGLVISAVGWRLLAGAARSLCAASERFPAFAADPDTMDDAVARESDDSFPASDAPSWTPTTGPR